MKKILLQLIIQFPFWGYAQEAILTLQTGHSAVIHYASFSPNQDYSLTVDGEGVAILWDTKTSKQLTTRRGVHAAEFAADGQSIYWAMTDRSFLQTNIKGAILQNFKKDNSQKYEFYSRYFYPEEDIMLYRNDLFNFKTGIKTNIKSGYNFYAQRYLKEIKQIVVGNEGNITFFDAQTGDPLKSWKVNGMDKLWTFSLSKDLSKILISDRRYLKILQLDSGTELANFATAYSSEEIHSAEYLLDGKSVFLSTKVAFYLLDASTLKVISKKEHNFPLSSMSTSSPIIRLSNDGKRVFIECGQNGLWVNTSTLTVEKELKGIPFAFSDNLKIDPFAKELSHTEGNNLMVFWNLKTGAVDRWASVLDLKGGTLDPVLATRNTPFNYKIISTPKYSTTLSIIDQENQKEVYAQKYPKSFVFSDDFSKFITANNDTITVKSLPSGKIEASHIIPFPEKDPAQNVSTTGLSLSKDNKTVLFQVTIPTENKNLEKLQAFDLTSENIIFSIDKRLPNDRVGDKFITHALLKPDNKTLATGTFDGFLRIFDVSNSNAPKEIKTIKAHDARINSIEFSPSGKFFFSAANDHKINVWRTEDWSLAATMYVFASNKDWAVITPEGQFEGTKGAMDNMYFLKELEVLPLSSLYEKFYTPHLLNRILEGETFDPLPVKVDDLKRAPSVKIKYKDGKRNLIVDNDAPSLNTDFLKGQITVEATSPDDFISEIRLYHNGKLVGSGTRNLVVEDDKIEKIKTQVFDIQLVLGENRFKAIALNSQRTESQPDEIVINFKAAETPPRGVGGLVTQMHLVIVGINKYKNPKYNLNYATADATSFKEAIEKGGTSIFSKINVVFIGDEKATKVGISDEFEKVKSAANPQDVFIFYYAGHGVLNQKKEFFLVPHDVTQLYGQDDALAQKGLSANQLQQFSKDIKAQKQLFILDACQSAGALDQIVAARGAAEEKAIAQLARATGTHWLTASGSEQFASEFTQLGHGTFTYVLLEALSGKADKGGDKKITVKELDAYLQEQVPEVTAKYKGTPQYPASYGFGNDFPIGVVKQ